MNPGALGTSPRRKEDPRLLRGAGRYLADRHLPGELHAAFLRSPHGHARIRSIELPPGVLAFTAAELAADLGDGLLIPARVCATPAAGLWLQPPLARGEVLYAGEPLAVVAAASRYAAEDALERIRVDYEPLPACTDPCQAPLVEELRQSRGDPAAAFAGAAHVIRARLRMGRQTGLPMETRGLLAEWDAGRDRLHLCGLTKLAHTNRSILARLLALPETAIDFEEGDIGGGFGVRGEFYPEDLIVPWLARRLRRPVRWVEDRREHLQAMNHAREVICDGELALAADGRFLALRCMLWHDQGAYVRTHGLLVPEATLALLPGPYRYEAFDLRARVALTHKTPVGTYRGPGRCESTFVRERLVDLAARRLGRDPADLRLQNLLRPEDLPYDCGTTRQGQPLIYEPADYPARLREALRRFDYDAWRARSDAGAGLALFVEQAADALWEYARVEVDPSGEVTVFSGGAGVGQGLETMLSQVCADALGVAYADVRVVHGDSRRVPHGVGSFGSRSAVVGGNAVREAALEVRRLALERAAGELEARPEDLELTGGWITVRGVPARRLTLGQVAAASRPPHGLGLAALSVRRNSGPTYSFGVHAAAVRVDPATGSVTPLRYLVGYDVGRAIHPRAIAGQFAGGVAQGLGGALLEDLAYDAAGQPLAGSLADYLLPTATDVPRVDSLIWEDASPGNPLGVKGAGEAGTPGPAAALANAVADALGERCEGCAGDLPLTPERVWDSAAPASIR